MVAVRYPTWLEGHVKDLTSEDSTTVTLCSTTGSELLEVWFYGDSFQDEGEEYPYIESTEEAPCRVVVRVPESGEEFLIFDGAKHGYDSMFCDAYESDILENRPLKRYEIPASKLILEIGYGIEYESERDEYDIDEDGLVELVDGRKMHWETVNRDGIDYIALFFVNDEGEQVQILDAELA